MLRKLIKYDLLWINRVMVFYYALTIVLSIFTRIASNLTGSVMGDIIYGIFRGITIAAFINVVINAAIRIWVRFRQDHYKDEAYLTHTLPVTKAQLFDSKILAALITTLIAVITVIACFFVAFWNHDLSEYFRNLVQNYDLTFTLVGIFVTALLEIIYMIAVGLFGIVVGHRQSNNRVVLSVVVGMALYFALQTILLAIVFCVGFFDDGVKAMFSNNPENAISFNSYRTLIIATDISYLALNVGLYFAAKKLFAKGVNVE